MLDMIELVNIVQNLAFKRTILPIIKKLNFFVIAVKENILLDKN